MLGAKSMMHGRFFIISGKIYIYIPVFQHIKKRPDSFDLKYSGHFNLESPLGLCHY